MLRTFRLVGLAGFSACSPSMVRGGADPLELKPLAGAEQGAVVSTPNLAARRAVRLRLMSFNVRVATALDGENRWQKRRLLAERVVRESSADIIGIQEATAGQLWDLVGANPNYSFVGVGTSDGGTSGPHTALLFEQSRVHIVARGVFWLSKTPDVAGSVSWGSSEPRTCVWIRAEIGGRELLIYNTHLDHRSASARRFGLEMVQRHMKRSEGPFVLMGDLNMTPDAEPLRKFISAAGLQDAWISANPTESNATGTFHRFQGEETGLRIDFILADRELKVSSSQIWKNSSEGRFPSDHYPISATLLLRTSEERK